MPTSSCSPPRSQCPPVQGSERLSSRTPVPARYAVAGAAVVALAVGFAQEERRLWGQEAIRPASPGQRNATGANRLRRAVGTDLPIVAYLADRRAPGQLVDTSFVRLGTGSLTDAEILEELEGVRAIVVGRESPTGRR